MKTASKIFYISLNTMIEAFKDRLVSTLLVTGILLIIGSKLMATLSFVEQRRIILDVGNSVIFGIGALLAIFASTNLLVREVETRRIMAAFSKPVRRSHFILGKYLGICMTLVITVAILSLMLFIFLKMQTGNWEPQIFSCSALLTMELFLLSALALFFSSFTTQFLGIFYTILIFAAGHTMDDVNVYANSTSVTSQIFMKMVIYFFPNLQVFNHKGAIVHNIPIGTDYLLLSAAYAGAFILVFVMASIVIFGSRDFNK